MTNLQTLSTEELRLRCEEAQDFHCDDEEAELKRRGYKLEWTISFYNPQLILHKLN